MAAISPGTHATTDDLGFVRHFLGASGKVVEVEERLQDAVTATSGSGPAYFFAFVEAMVAGAEKLGLSHEVATELTVQTLIGAAGMLAESGKDAKTLRENVTSPNGTTYAALMSFEGSDLSSIVANAMAAAAKRSAELA
jgi:pyrroline-5-carboxylate reductase